MSALHWFEIPDHDIERACRFYGHLLNTEINVLDLTEEMGSKMGMLPDRGGSGGNLVENKQYGYEPSTQGTLIFGEFQFKTRDTKPYNRAGFLQ